jgi:hypothetical protein
MSLNLLSSYPDILGGGVGGGEVPMVTDNVRPKKKLENMAVGARVILDCWNRGRAKMLIFMVNGKAYPLCEIQENVHE